MRALALLSFVFGLLVAPGLVAAAPPRNGDVVIGDGSRTADPLAGPTPPYDDALLVVVDSPYQVFSGQGTLVHVAAWKRDGTPARGATVYYGFRRIGRTDDHGVLVFRWGLPDAADTDGFWTQGRAVTVEATEGKRTLGGSVWFDAFARTESFASDQLFVYAERGVWSPGETLRMRMIGWHLASDYAPLKDVEAEVRLTGPRGTVGIARVRTDAWGTAHAELPIPANAPIGTYLLSVSAGGAEEQTEVRIEPFAAPRVRIETTLPRFLTRDRAQLAWEVGVHSLVGARIAQVVVDADFRVDGRRVAMVRKKGDGPGPHAMRLADDELAALRAALSDGQSFEVWLTIEDDRGLVTKLVRTIDYVIQPWIAVIETAREEYAEGEEVVAVVRLSDLDRVPARDQAVSLRVGERELKGRTDTNGTATFRFPMKGDELVLEAWVGDVDAALDVRTLFGREPAPMRSTVADMVLREGARTKVTIDFHPEFIPVEKVVHVDVVDTSGSLVESLLLPISHRKGKYQATGELRAPSWGSLLLTMFCLGRERTPADGAAADELGASGYATTKLGLLTEGQNLVVHPDRELRITLDGLPEDAAPGQSIQADVRVTNGRGEPVSGVLGAAIVDQGVLALRDPLEITPMDVFYNPELRTMSQTGSAMLTWPVVSRNWGESQVDIALPPFSFHRPGPVWVDLRSRKESAEDTEGEDGVHLSAPMALGSVGGMGHMSSGGGKGMGLGASSAPGKLSTGGIALDEIPIEGRIGTEGEAAQVDGPTRGMSIVLRTSLPETSLWAPSIEVRDGRARLEGRLAEAITTQEIVLVASDAQGGVGVMRSSLPVSQPLWVRAVPPDSLQQGQTTRVGVEVRNTTGAAVDGRLLLSCRHATCRAIGGESLRVRAGSAEVAWFDVTGDRVGDAELEVRYAPAEGSPLKGDGEVRKVRVVPSGQPEEVVSTGMIAPGQPHRARVEVATDASHLEVTVDVALPAVTTSWPVLAPVLEELARGSVESLGTGVLAAVAVYAHMGEGPERMALGQRIAAWAAMVMEAQSQSGGWGTSWEPGGSPIVTVWVVEALLEAHRAGVVDARGSLARAASWLLDRLETAEDLSRTTKFWEGSDVDVRRSVRAQAFAVLAELDATFPDGGRWERLALRVDEARAWMADTAIRDPMTLAPLGLGLERLVRSGRVTLDTGELAALVARLKRLRKGEHWEPGWFNAYGGSIEATWLCMRLWTQLALPDADEVVRDGVRYLLSTRRGWESWHNARGTAWAIRGLVTFASTAEVTGSIVVEVNGVAVERLRVDGSDPWRTAVAIRGIDLARHLRPGANEVVVRHDGGWDAGVRVTTRTWRPVGRAKGLSLASVEAKGVRIGDTLELRLMPKVAPREVERVRVTLPSGWRVRLTNARGWVETSDGAWRPFAPGERGGPLTLPIEAIGSSTGGRVLATWEGPGGRVHESLALPGAAP